MDYLDPKKKRRHAMRLYIGYALITVAIALATTILVFIGSGYFVDRTTGDVIQNGQLYINSDPDGATITLNGKLQRTKTAGRLVIPSGSYTIGVSRSGYRDWTQTITLDGGMVESLDYIRLLPKTLKTDVSQTFATTPTQIAQSVDRRYLAIIFPDKPGSVFIMDETRPADPPTEVVLAKTAFSTAEAPQLKITDWSDDNKHFLLENTFSGGKEYIIASRDTAEAAINLNTTLHVPGSEISLRDRSHNNFYVYSASTKTLATGSLDGKPVITKLTDVTAYATFGNDDVLYVTGTGASGKVQARLHNGDKSYLMRELTVAPSYLLDIAKLGSSIVVAVGSPVENKVTIVRNPVGFLKAHSDQTVPLADTVLQVPSPTEVSFSTDATTVIARGAQDAASHYFDADRTVKYTFTQPLPAQKLRWLDGKHITFVSGGSAYIADFDGSNVQPVVPSLPGLGIFYDTNYQAAYGFVNDASGKLFNITRSPLKVN